ncbi:tyrosine-type recombinase/integrase [Rathayibacter sp. VKM Ac-2760]|uniref:tyrosine-type recombinase/integrase n=1 Tax=Rathayibacter sp. VKM Ac-2760 TaxID=2609253 RepID=UPI00131692E2|nr:tyrosine-type recombinase/integrase [Rathayibacter sp. VKM Ac-2760]QHC59615.1 tyrosine-type recombinase/integrase [Rathayibacter sp. VKM Ac-2760]
MAEKRARRRGRGAIYSYATKAGKRWRWQIYEPVNASEPDGELRRVSKGGYRTADEADDGLRDALLKLKNHVRSTAAGGISLASFGLEWLDSLRLAPSTVAGYRRLFRLYIEPQLGTSKLDKITPSRLSRHYAELARSGGAAGGPISANTIRKAHVILGSILDAAIDDGLLASNPARRTRLVKAPTGKQVREQAPEMVTWSAEQLKRYLEWDRDVYGDEHFTYWLVLAQTGMRRSEALALKWADVDQARNRISIRRAADTINIGTVKSTKSGSARVVDVDSSVTDALRAWKGLRGSISLDLARGDAFIFGNDSGDVINPNRATMRWSVRVAAARRRLGDEALPVMGLHGLRHTHATLLLGAGIHPKVVQERLGHSDISITMSVYSHVTETMQRDAVDRLAAIMAGA